MRFAAGLPGSARCLTAVSASSIRQAKVALYRLERMDVLLARADALQRGRRRVGRLEIVEMLEDRLARLAALAAPGALGERAQASLDLGGQAQGQNGSLHRVPYTDSTRPQRPRGLAPDGPVQPAAATARFAMTVTRFAR